MSVNFDINNYKNNNITFKSRIPKGIFYDAKDIPRLRCAKCGKFMMSRNEEHILMYGIPLPSKEKIIDSIPKDLKQKAPYGYNFIWTEMVKNGTRYINKLFNQNKNTIIEGQSIKQSKQIKEILKFLKSHFESTPILPANKIIKNLENKKSQYPKETAEFIDILFNYTKKYPKRSLTEILTDKKLYAHHDNLRLNQAKEYKISLKKHSFKMFKTIKNLPNEEIEKLENLNETAYKIAEHKSISDKLRYYLIRYVYEDFLKNISDKKTKKSLEKQINLMPLAHASGDYIFCKAAKIKKINDKNIIKFINNPIRNTFEHVDLKSQGGSNDVSNGIYMCGYCNHERNNIPYPFLMKIFPDFIKNTHNQIIRLGTFIKKGTLIGYDTYPQNIKNTIKKVSGKDVKIEKFLKEQKKL